MRAPICDYFHVWPERVFRQAFTVLDARLETPCGPSWFLIFGRFAKSQNPPDGVAVTGDGGFHGVQVVAYRCEEYGVVLDWERRYESFGIDAEHAVRTLRLEIANGVAVLCNYEGELEVARQIIEKAGQIEIGDDFIPSIPPQ